ncbi:MAG TPA: hydroxyethylthiazole kinase [Armatimonadota bacterium]|nr:hydroxyethylthiazole kinase [Armatimonadota bacterium]
MNVADFRRRVRAAKPLVHHITNVVTTNDCANATLHLGALPVMANSPREAADMVRLAQALVLNIGTLHDEQIEAMLIAGARANELGIPIVLDPVGAGATPFRTETALRLLRELRITVIKGNAGEISVLAGEEAEVRGVESGHVADITAPAKALSAATEAVVAATGERDLVVSGDRLDWVDGGSERMKTFVGSGCVATSVIGCFLGTSPDRPHDATVAALTFYREAAQRAAALSPSGPVQYRDVVYTELARLPGGTDRTLL